MHNAVIFIATLACLVFVSEQLDLKDYTGKRSRVKNGNVHFQERGDCGDYQYMCDSGDCIPLAYVCDGEPDCTSGMDEVDCFCAIDEFQCADNECIPTDWVCDGMEDCEGGDDEDNCNSINSCGQGLFQCPSSDDCVALAFVCDGENDCASGADEVNCSCSDGEIQCRNNQCVPTFMTCDGQDDCGDGTDEEDCGQMCLDYEFHCPENDQCILDFWECDGWPDCPSGADEDHCEVMASGGELPYGETQACHFPFEYRSYTYYECICEDYHKPWCYVDASGDTWAECEVNYGCVTASGGLLPSGQSEYCQLPFDYEGETYFRCTCADHDQPWCYVDEESGIWANCEDVDYGCGIFHPDTKSHVAQTKQIVPLPPRKHAKAMPDVPGRP